MKDTVKISGKGNTKMIAHRGLSGIEQENTLGAFIAAGNRSYIGMECDVYVTSDERYIVFHDRTTGRLTNEDLVVYETEFERLRELKIYEPETKILSHHIRMPSLAEYLSVNKRYGKIAVVELERQIPEKNIKEILDICTDEYDLENVIFISFCFENLERVRKFYPQQKVQFLCDKLDDELVEKLKMHKFDLDIEYHALDKDNIKMLHDNGIVINCWTCDDRVAAEKLIEWGVDYITTNILE